MQDAIPKSFLKHKERRIYLRQEMNSLFHLLSDKPALLGPKFPVIIR